MDPFTLALATFGVQKLRGKSTKRSLRDALMIGGMGQLGGMAGVGGTLVGRCVRRPRTDWRGSARAVATKRRSWPPPWSPR